MTTTPKLYAYPEKGAVFAKPNSLTEMRNLLNKSKSNFAVFWTPVEKISSTECIDEGTIRTFDDTSLNLELNVEANRWADAYSSTGYGMV